MNELPGTAFGVMRLLPDTKSSVEVFSKQLINAVENGEVNPLELKAMFKFMEHVIKKVDEATKEGQLRQADKWAEKKFNAFGFEIEKAEVGTQYNYNVCNDPIYSQLLKNAEEAKTKLDDRTKFLKGLKDSFTMLDEDSGEVVRVHPPVKTSTSSLKFTIK